jgi:hypothetical protein
MGKCGRLGAFCAGRLSVGGTAAWNGTSPKVSRRIFVIGRMATVTGQGSQPAKRIIVFEKS